jgi:hypothetical protein
MIHPFKIPSRGCPTTPFPSPGGFRNDAVVTPSMNQLRCALCADLMH